MAKKLNMKMKALFAMLMCGLSTFTVFPQTDYSRNTHHDAASITNESWTKTRKILWTTIEEVGRRIEQEK
ncbi:hypothetical protein H6A05_07435 [Megasphaera elsdenii]|uniref:hypothetical protein n=1 Tax=Megasphaera elsdenii TaxID=907 RepID=UPI00195CD2F9|nr:hypothetical protein [Megasphaera elsdenii]MBM6702134.1 hypothetical protein [Megasphaera elsdenii]